MTQATFTYQTSASKQAILTALIQHLTPKIEDQTAFAGLITLENTIESLTSIQQNTLRNSDACNFNNGQLMLRMDYTESDKMAYILQLYTSTPQSYLPKGLQCGGTTLCYLITLYPLNETESNREFSLQCKPDYRGAEDSVLTQDQRDMIGIQSLRFGYDFICRALNPLMGEPKVQIEKYILSPQSQEQLLHSTTTTEDKLEIFKKIKPKQ